MVPKKWRDRNIDWELITSLEFYTFYILKLGLYNVKKDELLKYQWLCFIQVSKNKWKNNSKNHLKKKKNKKRSIQKNAQMMWWVIEKCCWRKEKKIKQILNGQILNTRPQTFSTTNSILTTPSTLLTYINQSNVNQLNHKNHLKFKLGSNNSIDKSGKSQFGITIR
jgi:lysozyme family protein